MEKMFILAISLFGIFAQADAQAVPFNYTGNKAEFDEASIYSWFPLGNSDNPKLGGAGNVASAPGGAAGQGIAEQFSLSSSTDISSINSIVTLFPEVTPNLTETTTFTYGLYSNSTFQAPGPGNNTFNQSVPLSSSKFFTSQPLTLTETVSPTGSTQTQTVDEQTPVDITLAPGTYWISEEGNGGVPLTTTQSYNIAANTFVAPEPPSVWLLFFGIAAAVMFKKVRFS